MSPPSTTDNMERGVDLERGITTSPAPPATSNLAVIRWEGLLASHESILVYAGPLRYIKLVNSWPRPRVTRRERRNSSDTSYPYSSLYSNDSRPRQGQTLYRHPGQTYWNWLIRLPTSIFKRAIAEIKRKHSRARHGGTHHSTAHHRGRESFEHTRDYDFESQVLELYGSTVFDIDGNYMVVNLASLQRINLVRMQRELLKEACEFRYGNQESLSDFDEKMHKYTRALGDWEYIKKCSLKGSMRDPYIFTTERASDRALILNLIRKWDVGSNPDAIPAYRLERDRRRLKDLPLPLDAQQPVIPFGDSRNAMNRHDDLKRFWKRLFMAAVGGAFLIGPMLLMVLHKSLLTTLLTTSLSVVAFGVLMAFYLDEPFDVLSGTAAYAAVLVVLVGTSTSSG